jgi:hypothetical protein
MDEMLALLPTGARSDDTIFLALFLLRLPASMRDHLAAVDHKFAADMARHANTFWDARAGESPITAIAAPVDAVAARSPAVTLAGVLQTAVSPAASASSAGRLRARIAAETSLSAITVPRQVRQEGTQVGDTLFLDGKLGRCRGQINTLGGLVYLQDSSSEQHFLVDTGAAVSVFRHRSSAAPSGPPLTGGADGHSIPSWGTVRKTLSFGLCTFIFHSFSPRNGK